MPSPSYDSLAMVARWQPVHRGHAAVLHALCKQARVVRIGIGSSNRHNARNPFTLAEIRDMLQIALADFTNYTIIPVPDLDDGPRWRLMVVELFGGLDAFVTGNPYVTHLLSKDYPLIHPASLVLPSEQVAVDGTQVRLAMARGEDWQALVPERIAAYILANGLDVRFRSEFGLETLALTTIMD